MNVKPILAFYRCLRPESNHFYEIAELYNHSSAHHHYLKYLNGETETVPKKMTEFICYIDTIDNSPWSYDELTEEQQSYFKEHKKEV